MDGHEDKRLGWAEFYLKVVVAALATIGAIGLYLTVDFPRRSSESRLQGAQADVAEHDAQRQRLPVLAVRPLVEQSASAEDMREVSIELQLTNAGAEAFTIGRLNVDVFEAAPTDEVGKTIELTKELFRIRTNDQGRPGVPIAPAAANEPVPLNYIDVERRKGTCPHGKLFSICGNSHDVEWKRLDGLSRTSNRQIELRPGESGVDRYLFLLTEYPLQHHRQWFRFVFSIEPSNDLPNTSRLSPKKYEIFLSGLPLAAQCDSLTNAGVGTSARWQPSAPLIPVGGDQ